MKKLIFMPAVQGIEKKDGYFTIRNRSWRIYLWNAELATLIDFADTFTDYQVVESETDANIILQLKDDLFLLNSMRADVRDQAYQLDINSTKVELYATTAVGIFYGLQTLRQIIRQVNGELPAMQISDWPDMPFRAVHLTLGSGHMPSFEKLKELIVNFSHCKINNFVFEYDDRFPWENHPLLVHPDALTKNQIRELIDYAKKHFINIIPLLDSLGHAQAYLKHKAYQHLAELPDNTAEMCPANPDTLIFIKELWTEILEVHQDCKFAHISGDEVFRLGSFCPQCQPFADENRLSELFFSYYKELAEWILEHGRRPILWADMVLKHPEKVSTMPKETIFNDWDYRGSGTEWTVTRMLNIWGLTIDKDNMELIPEEHRDYFDKYYLNDNETTFKPFPGIGTLKDYGFEVISSPASSTEAGMHLTSPPFKVSLNNNRYQAQAIIKANAFGLMNTFWSSDHDIIASMHGIWAGGAYSWKFKEEDNTVFLNNCEKVMMDSDDGLFAKYAAKIDSYNLPEPGVFTPIANENCPTTESFPLPACDKCDDPIVLEYLQHLKNNTQDVIKIEQRFSSATQDLPRNFGKSDDVFIDLTKVMNTNHASVIHFTGRNFTPLGTGKKICRGVEFNIIDPKHNSNRSAVGLHSAMYMPDWSQTVRIEINDRMKTLFFLNSCAYAPGGEIPAFCEIHYVDGNIDKYSFEVGKNVGDWNKANFELSAGYPAFIWYSSGDAGTLQSSYMNWWNNNSPEKKISHLELCSGTGDGYAFFFAITGRKK
jgi:Glycosyl hydrolase family 20, catalytic domain/Glycosyl hydrolase family 20, domain 2